MSITVCIAPAKTLDYPKGGGHLWAYLNWALGLRALGCQVIWLEAITRPTSADAVRENVAALKFCLERYGLVNCLALYSSTDETLPLDVSSIGCLDLDAATGADLLLELRYDTPLHIVKRFRRSACWTAGGAGSGNGIELDLHTSMRCYRLVAATCGNSQRGVHHCGTLVCRWMVAG